MKSRILSLAAVLAVLMVMTGCAPLVEDMPETQTLYATFYPVYALTEMIVRDVPGVELHCLVQPQDGCLRDYALSDWDIYLLAYSADIALASGNGLESFEAVLEQLPLVRITSGLELLEGEQGVGESHFEGANPFLYMSLEGALGMTENIAEALKVLNAENAEKYAENLVKTTEELLALQAELQIQTEVCSGAKAVVLNEALLYTAHEYGLDVAGVFRRESGEGLYESELEQCLSAIEDAGARLILIEQQAPKTLVDALSDAGYTVVKLNVMSTLREADGMQGYLDAHRENARALSTACENMHGDGEIQ